ncbi:MAG TPA: AI-2E family transporter [Chondromyces sp.]|nr:AI-2E family transporter [Chondromyces sp.]
MENARQLKWIYKIILLLLIFLLVYVVFLLRPLLLPFCRIILIGLLPFLVGGFIAYLLHPFVERLHREGFPRAVAILLIYILFFGMAGAAIYNGVPLIIHQLRDLSESAPMLTGQYKQWIHEMQEQTSKWPNGLKEQLDERVGAFEVWLEGLVERFINGLTRIFNVLLVLAVVPFISFYLLKDIDGVKKATWYLIPKKMRRKGLRLIKDIDHSLGGYIRGQFFVCLIVGSLSTFLFWLIGMKYPVLLGMILAVTNIIPYFGPIIGAIPAVILAATVSMKMIIYVVIVIFGLQFVEGNVLSPFIVGKSIHMHPLFIMAALIIGGEAGGVWGLILAVPVLLIIKVVVLHGTGRLAR